MSPALAVPRAPTPAEPAGRDHANHPIRPPAPWLLLSAATVLVAAVAWWLGGRGVVPSVHADEWGYLAIARRIWDGAPAPDTYFYPGYPAVAGLALLFGDDPLAVHGRVQVINAVLAAANVPLLFLLLRRLLPRLGARPTVAAALVAALYPSFLLFSGLTISENLFVPATTAALLLAHKAFGGAPGWWLALGLAPWALIAIHPRAYGVLVAVVIVGGVVAFRAGLTRQRLAMLSLGLTAGAGLARLAIGWSTTGDAAEGGYAPGELLGRLASVDGLVRLVVITAGQLWYLVVGSLGLVVLGVAAAITIARRQTVLSARTGRETPRFGRQNGSPSAAPYTAALALLATAGVLALSVLYQLEPGRIDAYVYGRYNEGALAPLLALGVGHLLRRGISWKRYALIAAAATIGGAVVAVAWGGLHLRGDVVVLNVIAVAPFAIWGHGLPVALITAAAVAATGLLVVLSRWRPGLASAALAAAFLATGVVAAEQWLEPVSAGRRHETVITDVLARMDAAGIPVPECVAVTPDALRWHVYNYRFLRPDTEFARTPPGTPPCSPLIVSTAGRPGPGSRVVVGENHAGLVLWVEPSPLQRQLHQAGWLLPPTAEPLPPPAREGEVSLQEPAPDQIAPGSSAAVAVDVRHTGEGAPWPNRWSQVSEAQAVDLVVTWHDGDRDVHTERVTLPRTLLPGDQVEMTVPLAVPEGAAWLTPGHRYRVSMALADSLGALAGPAPSFTVSVP